MQVRLPDDHRAGVDHPLHGARSTHRNVLAEHPGAVRRAQAGGVEQILGCEGDAGQGAHPALARERAGVGQRALAVGRDERVELAALLAPVEVVRDDLLGRYVAGADALCDLVTTPLVHGLPFYQRCFND